MSILEDSPPAKVVTNTQGIFAGGALAAGNHGKSDAQKRCVSGTQPASDQADCDTQLPCIAGSQQPPANVGANTQTPSAGGSQLASDQSSSDTQPGGAAGIIPPPASAAANTHAMSVGRPPPLLASGHSLSDTQKVGAAGIIPPPAMGIANTQALPAGGSQSASDQVRLDTHGSNVAGSTLPPAKANSNTQKRDAGGSVSASQPPDAKLRATPSSAPRRGGWLADPLLGVLADVVDDFEKVRVANNNRLEQLTRTGTDKDGLERGHGLTLAHPEIAKLAASVEAFKKAEHDAILNMRRSLRKHPLGAFQKRTLGVGEKQFARLLAVVGDPCWHDLHERPRKVSELWAYCGWHVITLPGSHSTDDIQSETAAGDPASHPHQKHSDNQKPSVGVAPKRQRNQKSNWNEEARKRSWLIAVSCMKQTRSPYRAVYDATRVKYADAVHTSPCVRCGPAGKPAPLGSPLTDGHKHARAIRAVAKEFLKDLWRESRHLYAESEESSAA